MDCAQPNDDALEKVMGATATRVTWQGQTAEDESLSALAIDLPEGSSVGAENVKVTVSNGSDRLDAASKVQVDGGSLVTVTFPEATPAGALVMVECNRTLLPGDGEPSAWREVTPRRTGRRSTCRPRTRSSTWTGTSPAEQLSSWLNQQDCEGVELQQVPAPVLRPRHHRHVGAGAVQRMAYRHRARHRQLPAGHSPGPSVVVFAHGESRVPRASAPRTSTSCAERRCFCRYTSRFSACRSWALKWICSCWAQSSWC